MRHSKLADKIEEVISEPSKMDIKLKVGWQVERACLLLGDTMQ